MKRHYVPFIIGGSAVLLIMLAIGLFQNFLGPILLNANPAGESSVVESYKKNESVFNLTAKSISKYPEEVDLYASKSANKKYTITLSTYDKSALQTITNEEIIEDDSLNANLLKIFNNLKYFSIGKNMNSIFFTKNSGLFFEQGLAYSLDGNPPTSSNMKIAYLAPTGEGWYYYRAD